MLETAINPVEAADTGLKPLNYLPRSPDHFFYMPYTYIIHSQKLKKYYIGACSDLKRRLYEHDIGHSNFTSRGIPWTLVYLESFETLLLAKRREKNIKNMKSKKYIERLIQTCTLLIPPI